VRLPRRDREARRHQLARHRHRKFFTRVWPSVRPILEARGDGPLPALRAAVERWEVAQLEAAERRNTEET
jgi:hypothetical protein